MLLNWGQPPNSEIIISFLTNSETRNQTIEQLENWLKGNDEREAIELLGDLSLDLPSILLTCIGSERSEKQLNENSTLQSAEYCLNSLVKYGNAKEIFMGLTGTIFQLLNDQTIEHYEEDSLENSLPSVGMINWAFLNVIISPLSTVTSKILSKTRNPNGFFDPFCQCLLGLLNECVVVCGQEQQCDQSVEIYHQIIAICRASTSIHTLLEDKTMILMTTSASLIFANSHNPFPLAKVYLTHREPKLKSSFLRLIKIEGSSKNGFERLIFDTHDLFDIGLVTKTQEILQPILIDLDLDIKKESFIQLCNMSEGILGDDDGSMIKIIQQVGYGRTTVKRLIRETQQGALVIQAFERFMKIDQGHEEGEGRFVDEQSIEALLSSTFLEPSLFMILSSSSSNNHPKKTGLSAKGLSKKIIELASIESKGCDRLLIFRSFRCLIHASFNNSLDRLKSLSSLIEVDYSDNCNIKSALLNLIREILGEPSLLLAPDPISDPTIAQERQEEIDQIVQVIQHLVSIVIQSVPFDLSLLNSNLQSHSHPNPQENEELIRFLVDLLNLVYLLFKIDLHNLTGIKKGTLNKQIKDFLISPIYEWINKTTRYDDSNTGSNRKSISTQNGGPSLDVDSLICCSIKISLDLCIEVFNQT
ncbi:hypothetical protein MJO29_016210 [Puccinia striiformis f. sp. tritici]|uniref:Uncharacterized protein n=1 Tax=Puccinia striiformis f. sp. tritici PST-78 TaxID=1165861 RepID=A0A0L0VDS5_9BASI|nr:hypothetical protein Pst134EA_030461 [Puccinia striiformis f. sp. tritici]KAH9446548.1 hypothetical protein Pst134EA_030461 [Puccinia striiformis f. sp. tritici]KAI7934947.1 hypothetical protein MJO29_016210 [Puccinia striiformis f. sp. tritici]KNE97435.1 hypothetical protein PSTG_09269 [Puccinia striiformis f. sp. tritici PST-78]